VKTVSRRSGPSDPVADARVLQRTMNRLRGFALVPKGVYRFHTHEEADRWMMREIVATHARLRSRTSPPSAER
jgi:hypothetical protein